MAEAQTFRIGKARYGGGFCAASEPQTSPSSEFEVPFVLPGELIRLSETADQVGSPDSAESLQFLERSPSRIAPGCRHFGMCGGCQYQHMAAGEQLQLKAELLTNMLRQKSIPLPDAGIRTHAANAWQYRNRVRLRLLERQVGYSRRHSNEFLPVRECPILSPLLWRAATHLQSLSADWPLAASEVEFFATATEDALQMSLHLNASVMDIDRSAPARFRHICDALSSLMPELKGAGLLVQSAPSAGASRRVQERQRIEVSRWGEPTLRYRVAQHTYTVSRNAFFQVNRFLTEELVQVVLGSRKGALALDLYAGAGLFSVALAERFTEIISVEIGQPAADDLKAAMRALGPQHTTEQKTTLGFLQSWRKRSGAVPDLVVVDPPRAGLGPQVVAELLKGNARTLVYVSCDPTTFARDCRALVESRYLLEEVHLLDLFPQTFHMETIAILRHR